jgi:hypothetical protein
LSYEPSLVIPWPTIVGCLGLLGVGLIVRLLWCAERYWRCRFRDGVGRRSPLRGIGLELAFVGDAEFGESGA